VKQGAYSNGDVTTKNDVLVAERWGWLAGILQRSTEQYRRLRKNGKIFGAAKKTREMLEGWREAREAPMEVDDMKHDGQRGCGEGAETQIR
jgi:hypothetical protein